MTPKYIFPALIVLCLRGSMVAAEPTDLEKENAQLRAAVAMLWPQDWGPWNGTITQKDVAKIDKRVHPWRNWKHIPTKSLSHVQEEGREQAAANIVKFRAEIKWLESDPRGLRPQDRKRIEQLRGWIAEDQDAVDGKPLVVN